jgi:hypothetical protein
VLLFGQSDRDPLHPRMISRSLVSDISFAGRPGRDLTKVLAPLAVPIPLDRTLE